jgi:hypothetical protein
LGPKVLSKSDPKMSQKRVKNGQNGPKWNHFEALEGIIYSANEKNPHI